MAASAHMSFGVSLIDDFEPGIGLNQLITLGVIQVDSLEVKLAQLRLIIDAELKDLLINNSIEKSNFLFVYQKKTLTFQINENQEDKFTLSDVLLDDIIVIKRKTELHRIWIFTENMHEIGFVESKLITSLKDFRKQVKQLLKKTNEFKRTKLLNILFPIQFQFYQRNGNLVLLFNEDDMKLSNIIDNTNNSVRINLKTKDAVDGNRTISHVFMPNVQSLRSLSIDEVDEVMISYARSEASAQAELLYSKLLELNVKVFLDRHGIECGSDWQDKLNAKIHECRVFVAFITSSYGKTKWTDAEFKAAVLIDKCIVPVKFTDSYPPENYTLQLGSIHFVEGVQPIPTQYKNNSWTEEEALRVAYAVQNKVEERKRSKRIEYDTNLIHCDSVNVKVVFVAHFAQIDVFEKLSQLLVSQLPDSKVKCSLFHDRENIFQSNSPQVEVKSQKNLFLINEKEGVKREHKIKIKTTNVVITLFSQEFSKSKSLLDYFNYARLYKNVNIVICDETPFRGWLSQHVSNDNCFNAKDEKFDVDFITRIKSQINSSEVKTRIEIINSLDEKFESLLIEYNRIFICVDPNTVLENENQVFEAFVKQLSKMENTTIVTYGVNAIADYFSKNAHSNGLKILNVRTDSGEEMSSIPEDTVFVGKCTKETMDQIAMLCDACILITDDEKNSDALYSFIWNAKHVIPVLVNEHVEIIELASTLNIYNDKYGVNQSQLTLNGSNGEKVAETVVNLIEELDFD